MNNENEEIIEEGIIPQNFSWRAGITEKPKQSPMGDPGQAMAQAFLQSLDRRPPRVEMPPIRKSKQDQYWDAVMNNSVIWKTGEDDTRPETQGELRAMQNPIMICD